MISHENYEKRSLNMEFNVSYIIKDLQDALERQDIKRVVNSAAVHKLAFIKDYLPDGTPCWRLPPKEEQNNWRRRDTEHEI